METLGQAAPQSDGGCNGSDLQTVTERTAPGPGVTSQLVHVESTESNYNQSTAPANHTASGHLWLAGHQLAVPVLENITGELFQRQFWRKGDSRGLRVTEGLEAVTLVGEGGAWPWGKLRVRWEQEGPREGGKKSLGGRHRAGLGLKGQVESTAFLLSFQRAVQVLIVFPLN